MYARCVRIVDKFVEKEPCRYEQTQGIDAVIEHQPEEKGKEICHDRCRIPVSILGDAEEVDYDLKRTDQGGVSQFGRRIVFLDRVGHLYKQVFLRLPEQ